MWFWIECLLAFWGVLITRPLRERRSTAPVACGDIGHPTLAPHSAVQACHARFPAPPPRKLSRALALGKLRARRFGLPLRRATLAVC